MKNTALTLSASVLLFLAACSSNNEPSKNSGNDQVKDPVMNSGPETETERAVDATRRDSASADYGHPDSTVRK